LAEGLVKFFRRGGDGTGGGRHWSYDVQSDHIGAVRSHFYRDGAANATRRSRYHGHLVRQNRTSTRPDLPCALLGRGLRNRVTIQFAGIGIRTVLCSGASNSGETGGGRSASQQVASHGIVLCHCRTLEKISESNWG
jgi:hypothetical protein